MFPEGVNEASIDVVDGDSQKNNNQILGHSLDEGVLVPNSICRVARYVHFVK